MNEQLANEIRTVKFTAVRLREGYDMSEVDAFLDVLAGTVESGQPVRQLADGARFTPVHAREGYTMSQVDAFLDRVVREVEGAGPGPGSGSGTSSAAPGGPPPPFPTVSTPSMATAANVVHEQRGLLARLLGRRST